MPPRKPDPLPDPKAQLVLEQIERAFAHVKLGDGVSLRETEVIDDYGTAEERKKARTLDELHDWQKIPDDALDLHQGLAFFDAQGLVFHLPAYMSFALRNYRAPGSCSVDFTIYTLSEKGEYLDLLTPPQKTAIRHFLKFMAHNTGRDGPARRARKALETVWKIGNGTTGD